MLSRFSGASYLLCSIRASFVHTRSFLAGRKRLGSHFARMTRILDYSKVSVKPCFLQNFGVPGIGHYEAIRKELVRLLREERKRRKLSNYAVCQRSGVSESMLSLVERGLRNPTVETILRMADGIGANLPALIKKATATVVRGQEDKTLARKGRSKSET
jgi:hypothetical protein